MSRFNAPEYGPRGLKGAETVRQGFVDVNAIIDRDEIESRISNERSGKIYPKMVHRTEDEWDVAYNEFLITPIMHNGYGDRDQIHDIPVTSTVAGIKSKVVDNKLVRNVQRMLDDYQPAGLSMTRIVYKPENASVVPPQRKLASQIRGSYTADSYHQDMPFGALVRLEPNTKPQSSHGYIGTNKLRLIAKPESDGKPFSARLQERMWDHFHNPVAVNDEDKGKVDLAMDDVFEAFADVIAVALAMQFEINQKVQQKNGGNAQDALNSMLGLNQNKTQVTDARRLMMQHLFAGMNANIKSADSRLLKGGALANTTTRDGKIQKMQVEACAKFFEKMMDAMRVDNMWVVGKVIRPCQSPGKFDAMFI